MERAKSSKSESVPFTNLGTTQSVTRFKSSSMSSRVFPPICCPITLLEKRTSILAGLSGVRGSPPSWDGGRLCGSGGQGLLPEEYNGVWVGSNFFFFFFFPKYSFSLTFFPPLNISFSLVMFPLLFSPLLQRIITQFCAHSNVLKCFDQFDEIRISQGPT